MKKLILFLVAICIYVNCNAQQKYQREATGLTSAHLLTLGGGAFTIAGFLTPANFTSYNAPNNTSVYNMQNVTLPFWQQGPRATCIVAGITVTCTGLIEMISKR